MVVNDGVSLKTFAGEGFWLATGQLGKKCGFNTGYESVRKLINEFAKNKILPILAQ